MTKTKSLSLSPTDLEFRIASALGRISRLEAVAKSHSIKLGDKAKDADLEETEYDMDFELPPTGALEPEEPELTAQEVPKPENDTAASTKSSIGAWIEETFSNEAKAARLDACCRRVMTSQFLLGCLYFVLCTLLCTALFTVAGFGYKVYMGQLNVAVWHPGARQTWTVIGGTVGWHNRMVLGFDIKLALMKYVNWGSEA